VFTIRRQIADRNRQLEITWFECGLERAQANVTSDRGLTGDEDLVRRAIRDEIDGRAFRATPTGPFITADLDDDWSALIQLTSYFMDGYAVSGCVRTLQSSVPAGAIP
jgi:hypothetical protein